jgi:CheY-specific phosphatase CheX
MGAAEKRETPESQIPALLQTAVVDAFQVQAGLKVQVGEVVMEPAIPAAQSIIDCMSVIGVKTDNFQGSLALGFPKSTFLKIVEKMIGETHETISQEVADASGELLNIIYASARVKMNQLGMNFRPAIPATILGKELSLCLGTATSFLKFTCQCEYGTFFVALNLKRIK